MIDEQLLERILPGVEKPSRYTGNEWGRYKKSWQNTKVKLALLFPDVYEIGMSHLGLKILYDVVNRDAELLAERAFAPWPDFGEQLKKNKIPLYSLESRHALSDFDFLGFSLQYELCYTNILWMLDLAGIPYTAGERLDRYPLVMGGGTCAFNPEPLADFFDLFVLGEGEEVILELLHLYKELKSQGMTKQKILRKLADIRGVYVPSLYEAFYDESGAVTRTIPRDPSLPAVIRKRIVKDLDHAPFPSCFVMPYIEIVHDRAMAEIMRGCAHGCRFCQAGFIYRPVREKNEKIIKEQLEQLLSNTGYEEASLASLSSSDHSSIGSLVEDLLDRYDPYVTISLPSLRANSFSLALAEKMQSGRKTTLTLAPEAGTQRLRDVINKCISEEDLFNTVGGAVRAGWQQIKLYFMIGLPSEEKEDLLGLCDLVQRLASWAKTRKTGKGRITISVSISTFIPKAHTPFQWAAQNSLAEIMSKQQMIREHLRKVKVDLHWHNAEMSFWEGVFSRGDRRIGKAIQIAYESGCRFDAWQEFFRPDLWHKSFDKAGLKPEFYNQRERPFDETFPWDHLSAGVDKQYLIRENQKAFAGLTTPNCRTGKCPGCGVCKNIK